MASQKIRAGAALVLFASVCLLSVPAAGQTVVIGQEETEVEQPVMVRAPMAEFARKRLVLGFEIGPYRWNADDFAEWMDEQFYFGIRYSQELGLNLSYSVMAGMFMAETKVVDGEDIQWFPVRAQIEVGTLLGASQSRWYVAGGAGYNISDDLPSPGKVNKWPNLPDVSSEPIINAVVGFEFREKSLFSSRLEWGHMWLTESSANLWTTTLTVSYQF